MSLLLRVSFQVRLLQETFESAYRPYNKAPCAWGFKIFPSHVNNETFMSWLWERMDAAIILERRNGARTLSSRDS